MFNNLPPEIINYIFSFHNPYKDQFNKCLINIKSKEIQIRDLFYKDYYSVNFYNNNHSYYNTNLNKYIFIVSIDNLFNVFKKNMLMDLFLTDENILYKYRKDKNITINNLHNILFTTFYNDSDYFTIPYTINKILKSMIDIDALFINEYINKFTLKDLMNIFIGQDMCCIELCNIYYNNIVLNDVDKFFNSIVDFNKYKNYVIVTDIIYFYQYEDDN